MKNVSDKSCRENWNTHFTLSNFPPPPENLAVYEVTWKNCVERGRPRLRVWRLRIACWPTGATNPHWGCVIMLLHCNNGCTNKPRCYLMRTLPILFCHVAGRCIVGVKQKLPAYILLLLLLLLLLSYLNYLRTCLLAYLLTHLLSYLLTFILSFLLTYILTRLLTF